MADFAHFGTAVERVRRWPVNSFMAAYQANRQGVVDANLEGSPVYQALQAAIVAPWEGTASELLEFLQRPENVPDKLWPHSPRGLSGKLRRMAPALRMIGWVVTFDDSDHRRGRIIQLENPPAKPSQSSVPSEPEQNMDQMRTVEDVADGCGRSWPPKTPPPDGWDGTDGYTGDFSDDEVDPELIEAELREAQGEASRC